MTIELDFFLVTCYFLMDVILSPSPAVILSEALFRRRTSSSSRKVLAQKARSAKNLSEILRAFGPQDDKLMD